MWVCFNLSDTNGSASMKLGTIDDHPGMSVRRVSDVTIKDKFFNKKNAEF